MRKINRVGIAGAGTMGSALAQKFAQEGFSVVLLDTQASFLEKGITRIEESLGEAAGKNIISPAEVESIMSRINVSTEMNSFAHCDLVIEAIFEDFETKSNFFSTISSVVGPDAIIATNTSSFSVNELAKYVTRPERFLGMHYFYHAAKNRLVEIIPGEKTSSDIFRYMLRFSSQTGKDYIICKDSYGFVVNRFFVPWLNEAVRLLEEKIGSPGVIDSVCKKVFSIGMGPFELMNATGVSIAYHAQKSLEHFGPLYKTSDLLKAQSESGKNWSIDTQTSAAGQPASDAEEIITKRMLGVIFLVCSQILDEKICTPDEINQGARIGLKWRRGPIELMLRYGREETQRLIRETAALYNTPVPVGAIRESPESLNFVSIEKNGGRALISITRPEDLNALNWTVVRQLSEKFQEAEADPDVTEIFFTGRGKAFVAGADIKFFLDNIKAGTIDNILSFTKFSQDVFQKIDESRKTVVAVLNGLTLGGGLELALCADVIFALPDAALAFPETGIGIYPGLGGTQRTQRRIGKELTKYLVFTGDMINADNALTLGLIDGILQWDDFYCLIDSGTDVHKFITKQKELGEKYSAIKKFFGSCPVQDIYSGRVSDESGLTKRIKRKAPIALSISEKLINEARGCASELQDLKNIFSTSDALLGLSSIGKKVEFQGR